MDTDTERTEQETLQTRVEIEELDACKRRIKAAIPAEKVTEELDRGYRDLGATIQLPGFRVGRVPRRLLEARFGKELEKELQESLVQRSFAEVVEEKELKLVGSPKFDNVQLEKGADLTYDVEVEVAPEFELGDYMGLEVQRESEAVSDDAVQAELERLRGERADLEPVEPNEGGPEDHYAGSYQLFRGDVRVKTVEDKTFTPASKVIDVFPVEDLPERTASWDKASGTPLVVDVKVPETYEDEVLRGADARLEFHLDQVQRVKLPELNDEFANELGQESLEALRSEFRKSLDERARRREDARLEEKLLEKLVETTDIPLPEGLLEGQSRAWRSRREYELLVEQGLPAEQVTETLDKEGQAAGEDARRELKAYFVLDRIAEREKIFVTEDEVEARLRILAAYYGVPVSRLAEEMREGRRMEEMRLSILHQKVKAFLRKKARVLGPDGKPEVEETAAGGAAPDDEKAEDAGASDASGDAAAPEPETQGGEEPAPGAEEGTREA